MSDNSIKLNVTEEGVFLLINRSDGHEISRRDVMEVVERNQIRDIDFVAVNSIFKNDSQMFATLISRNTSVLVKKEDVKITISPDRLLATITFVPPINCETYMTFSELKGHLSDTKIVYGVDEQELKDIFDTRQKNLTYVVAKGLKAVNGTDGYITRHFKIKDKNHRPKFLEDGTVDYKQMDLIDVVNENDMLLEGIPPVAGSDGMDILGKAIAHIPGKPFPGIIKTKNTKFSDDGRVLYAACSGQLVNRDNKVEVFPVLQITHDINNSIGNVDFVGSVVISGNVLTGFSVKAAGNIEVHGVLEGGELIAGENITLTNGAQGMEKGKIHAGGNIRAKYIDQCDVYAGGDILTDFIVYSKVRCGGKVTLAGKRGLLLGGRISAGESITAETIGGNLSANTEIELGFEPSDFEIYKDILDEIKRVRYEYEKVLKMEAVIASSAGQNQDFDWDMENHAYSKLYYEGKLEDLRIQIENFAPGSTSDTTFLVVNRIIHGGVSLTIGNDSMMLNNEYGRCRIFNDGGKIKIEEDGWL